MLLYLLLQYPQIIGTSSFFLTAYSEESNIGLKSSKFTQAASYIIFISVPIIIFFLTASENFISIILEREPLEKMIL